MSKRSRSSVDTLTGGTHDVNLQTLGGTVAQATNDAFTEVNIPVPVNRVTMNSSMAQVIELLWVEFSLSMAPLNAANESVRASLTTSSKTAAVGINDPDMLASVLIAVGFLLTSGMLRCSSVPGRLPSSGRRFSYVAFVPNCVSEQLQPPEYAIRKF